MVRGRDCPVTLVDAEEGGRGKSGSGARRADSRSAPPEVRDQPQPHNSDGGTTGRGVAARFTSADAMPEPARAGGVRAHGEQAVQLRDEEADQVGPHQTGPEAVPAGHGAMTAQRIPPGVGAAPGVRKRARVTHPGSWREESSAQTKPVRGRRPISGDGVLRRRKSDLVSAGSSAEMAGTSRPTARPVWLSSCVTD